MLESWDFPRHHGSPEAQADVQLRADWPATGNIDPIDDKPPTAPGPVGREQLCPIQVPKSSSIERVPPRIRRRRRFAMIGPRSGPRRSGLKSSRNRSEEHTSELQSHSDLVCRLLLEKKNAQYSQRRRRATHQGEN